MNTKELSALVVTNLYPVSNDSTDKNTKALHDIFSNWRIQTKVIRPVFLPSLNANGKTAFILDNINILVLPIWKIPKTSVYFYKRILNRSITKEKYDVIISHRLHSSIGGYLVSKNKGIPLILGLHASDMNILQKKSRKYKKILEHATLIACRSNKIHQDFLRVYPNFKDKSFIAFSGINREIICNKKTMLEKQMSWKTDKKPIKFISVAYLRKNKNIGMNLIALSKLPKSINWEYDVIGNGRELIELERIVKELDIDDRVNFLGYQKREIVFEKLQEADIFILVSNPETFGLVYLEAMAKGCIVIGAKNNGIDGVIKNKINGYLCEPNDYIELNQIIRDIVTLSEEDLKSLIKSNYNTIVNYTLEKAARNYESSIMSVISR